MSASQSRVVLVPAPASQEAAALVLMSLLPAGEKRVGSLDVGQLALTVAGLWGINQYIEVCWGGGVVLFLFFYILSLYFLSLLLKYIDEN